jgi:alpha-tubulin suppressor-like RCC1 family protein
VGDPLFLHRVSVAVLAVVAASGAPAQAQSVPVYQLRVPVQGLVASQPAAPEPVPVLVFQDAAGAALGSLAFPDTPVGSNSAPLSVTLKNTGNAELTLNTPPAFTAAPFSVSGTTCAVSVVFSPTAQQAFSGSLSTDSSIAPKTLPLSGTGTMVGVTRIVSGGHHTFVQKSDGTWSATGYNIAGQLGLGDTVNRSSFTKVPALTGATSLALGNQYTIAKLADGSWAAAGRNSEGQLGLGDTANRTSFTPVPGLANATQVIAVFNKSFARYADGTWAATGYNQHHSLGLPALNGIYTHFTAVPALNGATQVMASEISTFAKLADGTWLATGNNYYGQLGFGDRQSPRTSFTPVPPLAGAKQVVAGPNYTFVERANGDWASVGFNAYGQLGLGDTTNRYVLTTVPTLAGASQVRLSAHFVFAKLANDTWAGTGYNYHGQLGLGDTSNRLNFITVSALTGASEIVVGEYQAFAKLADGAWAATGNNSQGQLGLGDTAHRTSFTPYPVAQ